MRRRGSILPLVPLSILALVLLLHDPFWSATGDMSGPRTITETRAAATTRYRLDAAQSKFIAHAHRGGLLWFKGHDQLVAAREVSGGAERTPGAIPPSASIVVL